MIIVLKKDITDAQLSHLIERIEKLGLKPMVSRGTERTIVGVIGPEDAIRLQPLEVIPGAEKVIPILAPYKLVSQEFKKETSLVEIRKGIVFGGKKVVLIAGPCSIESKKQMLDTARAVKRAGAHLLRGGAFKPRTSPYDFQGLGKDGLAILKEVSEEVNMPTVTEVMDTRDVSLVAQYADVFQVGARNMQNFDLLKEIGMTKKPVILKRGFSATIKEWLMSAEYILSGGNFNVILCERGIRTFENHTRNTLDLSAVVAAKELSHLPVAVDPSHATGRYSMVTPLALAAVACGADGLLIEVHPNPEEALSDGPQQLVPDRFEALVQAVKRLAPTVGRE